MKTWLLLALIVVSSAALLGDGPKATSMPSAGRASLVSWSERNGLLKSSMDYVGLVDIPESAERVDCRDIDAKQQGRFRHFVQKIVAQPLQPSDADWKRLVGWQGCRLQSDSTAALLHLDYQAGAIPVQIRDTSRSLSIAVDGDHAENLSDQKTAAAWLEQRLRAVLHVPAEVPKYNCYMVKLGKVYCGKLSQHGEDFSPAREAFEKGQSEFKMQWWESIAFATDGKVVYFSVAETDGVVYVASQAGFPQRQLRRQK